MNFQNLFRGPFFERGCKGTHYFLTSKFFIKIFKLIFCVSLFKNFRPISHPVFQRECKGTTFFQTSKLFCNNLQSFLSPKIRINS